MRRSKLNPTAAQLPGGATASRTATICIVDREPADFHPSVQAAWGQGAVVHCVTSAGEALRLARAEPVELWVINTDLLDHTGIELCDMLRQRHPRTTIFLMAESPTAELEQAAWAARPTLFGGRNQHSAWLDQWLDHRRCRRAKDVGHGRGPTAANARPAAGHPPSAGPLRRRPVNQ